MTPEEISAGTQAGFTPEELSDASETINKSALSAGFSPKEIAAGNGKPEWDPTAFKKMMHFGIAQALQVSEAAVQPAETPEEKAAKLGFEKLLHFGLANMEMMERAAITPARGAERVGSGQAEPSTVTNVTGPKPTRTFGQGLDYGVGMSSMNLAITGKPPNMTPPEDENLTARIGAGIGEIIGDIPLMMGGYQAVGGGIVGVASSFAVPQAVRSTIVDAYKKHNFDNFEEFWDRAAGIAWDTTKSYLTGLTMGAAGKVAGGVVARNTSAAGPVVPPAVAHTALKVAPSAAELATMTTVGKALEGEVPSWQDFAVNAAILAGAHVAIGSARQAEIAGRLMDIWETTGRKPADVVNDPDPTIVQRILARLPEGEAGELQNIDVKKFRQNFPGFFSELERQVDALRQNAAPASQWKNTINALKGVKRDEIDATGLHEWLEMQGDRKVPKSEVQDFLSKNGVEIEERILGEPPREPDHQLPPGWSIREPESREARAARTDQMDALQERISVLLNHRDLIENQPRGNSHLEALQGIDEAVEPLRTELEGLYREHRPFTHEVLDEDGGQRGIGYGPVDALHDAASSPGFPGYVPQQPYMPPQYEGHVGPLLRGKNYRELLFRFGPSNRGDEQTFSSQHFGSLGKRLFAHARIDERMDAQGKKVLFIQEIQSDHAQQGRDSGWQDPQAVKKSNLLSNALNRANLRIINARAELRSAIEHDGNAYRVGFHEVRNQVADGNPNHFSTRVVEAVKEFDVAYYAHDDAETAWEDFVANDTGRMGVPPAPFVGKTESWTGLVMKRLIRYAVERGYDHIAWTTGEQQNQRWSQSAVMSRIAWSEPEGSDPSIYRHVLINTHRHGRISLIVNKDGVIFSGSGGPPGLSGKVEGEKLSNLVPKDMADKIMNEHHGDLSGNGLEVGGRGMKEYYDKIVHGVANDILKKLGSGRVREMEIRKFLAPWSPEAHGPAEHEHSEGVPNPDTFRATQQEFPNSDYDVMAVQYPDEGGGEGGISYIIRQRNHGDGGNMYWTGHGFSIDETFGWGWNTEREANQALNKYLGRERPKEPAPPPETIKQPGFEITKEMADRVMQDGFALMNLPEHYIEDAIIAGTSPVLEGARVSALKRLRKLFDDLQTGKIDNDKFVKATATLLVDLEAKREMTLYKDSGGRARGADYVEQRLLEARRRGDLDNETVAFARWLLQENPKVAEGLGISVRSKTEDKDAVGFYNPVSRVITLMKGQENPHTAVHEILHHTERMLPPAVRKGLVDSWARELTAEIDGAREAGDEKRSAALQTLVEAIGGKAPEREALMKLFRDKVLTYADYHLVNPSEYWAVKGSAILSRRYEALTWQAKAAEWVREFVQKARDLLGLRSDAPVMRALDEMLKTSGDETASTILWGSGRDIAHNLKPDEKTILDHIIKAKPDPWWKRVSSVAALKSEAEDVYTHIFDNLNPILVDQRGVEKNLPMERDAYKLERLTRGVMGKFLYFMERGTFSFKTLGDVGDSYFKILGGLDTLGPSGEKISDLDGFRVYMTAKRGWELEGRGMKSGLPVDVIGRILRDPDLVAKYEPIFQARLKFIKERLDYLEDSGVIGAAQRAAIEAANRNYVPFYRFFEGEERPGGRKVRNPIKRIKGSDLPILDPIESDIKDTALFITLADRNASRRAFVALGEMVAEKIPSPVRPIEVQEPEVRKFLEDHGLDPEAAEPFTIFRAMRKATAKDEIVVFEDGKPEIYRVRRETAEAFDELDSGTANVIMHMLMAPARWLRGGTTISPDFFPRNLMRDAVSAAIYAASHPGKTAMGAYSLIVKDRAYDNWMKGGGATATMVSMDRNYINRELYKLDHETGLMHRAINVASTPIEILRIVSEFAENATRLGSVRSEMMDAKDKAAIQALAFISREATVDFSVHGSDPAFRKWTLATAFMNPGLQGIARMGRAFRNDPITTLVRSLAFITAPSVLLWLKNHDDKRWNDIPRWEKDLFHIVMTGHVTQAEWAAMPQEAQTKFAEDHTIFRIPKTFELGVAFGSLPERLLEAFVDDNPDAFKDLSKSFMNAFGVNFVPTIAVPVMEQFANRNYFTGHALVSQSAENLLPEYQYNTYTTELAKTLGHAFGAFPGLKKLSLGDEGDIPGGLARALSSPTLIENYVRGWSGGLGVYLFKITDAALRKSGTIPDPPKPDDTLADVPFVKAWVVRYPQSGAAPIQDFYDQFNGHKKVFDTVMFLFHHGKGDEAMRELHFDPAAVDQLTGYQKVLGQQANLIRMWSEAPVSVLSGSDKRQIIDTAYLRMTEIAGAGVKLMNQMEKQAAEAQRQEALIQKSAAQAGFLPQEITHAY